MKAIILYLFLLLFPFGLSLADEGVPCGGDGGATPSVPSSEPSSSPSTSSGGGEPTNVGDQIGLTYGTCLECDKPLGPDSFSEEFCSPECNPDQLIAGAMEGIGDMFESAETAFNQFVAALANFPSYQFDASHASVPSPQGY